MEGLYMESHGIVGNSIFDEKTKERVNFLSNDSDSMNAKWWDKAGKNMLVN